MQTYSSANVPLIHAAAHMPGKSCRAWVHPAGKQAVHGQFHPKRRLCQMSSDAMLYFCIPAQLSVFFSLSFWHKQFVGAFGIRPISSHSILLALFSFCFNAEFQQVTRCDLFAFAFLNLGRVLLFPFSFPFSFVSFPPFVGEMNGLQRFFIWCKPLQLISSRVVQTYYFQITASNVPTVQRSW